MQNHYTLAEEAGKVIPLSRGKILLMGFESSEGRYASLKIGRRAGVNSEVYLLVKADKGETEKQFVFTKNGFIPVKKSMSFHLLFDQVVILENHKFFNNTQDILLDSFLYLKEEGLVTIILSTINIVSINLLERLISGLPQLQETKGLLEKVGYKEPFITKAIPTYKGVYLTARKPPEIKDEDLEELFLK